MESLNKCDRHEVYYKDSFCPVCCVEEELWRLREEFTMLENLVDEMVCDKEILNPNENRNDRR